MQLETLQSREPKLTTGSKSESGQSSGDGDYRRRKSMDSGDPSDRTWIDRGRICDDDKKGETRR